MKIGNLFFTKEESEKIDEEEKKNKESSVKTPQTFQENEHDKRQKEWLKNQVENYDTLDFWKSARKIAAIIMAASVAITLVFAVVSIDKVSYLVWVEIIAVSVLAFFVYKGKEWAMIVAMIYWTLGKGYQLIGVFSVSAENFYASSMFMPIFWWLVWLGSLRRAYRVEKARIKNTTKE